MYTNVGRNLYGINLKQINQFNEAVKKESDDKAVLQASIKTLQTQLSQRDTERASLQTTINSLQSQLNQSIKLRNDLSQQNASQAALIEQFKSQVQATQLTTSLASEDKSISPKSNSSSNLVLLGVMAIAITAGALLISGSSDSKK